MSDGLDGDDLPDIFGDYVADEEVYFFTGIDFSAGSGGLSRQSRKFRFSAK